MRLLLLSNGYAMAGQRYLAHALDAVAETLAGARQVLFVPFASRDCDEHTAVVADALAPLGVTVTGLHDQRDAAAAIGSAPAVFVGGGNAFRLLATLHRLGVLPAISDRVRAGMPYLGSSAGTNLACPTIRTTNDLPIVEPPSLTALGLVPFQINPHYPAQEARNGHLGVTRDRRLAEFLQENDVAVLGLQEGSWLAVHEGRATVDGNRGGRLFERGALPREVPPGTDVSRLLSAPARFDHPGEHPVTAP